MVEILAINKEFYAKVIARFDKDQLRMYDTGININSLDIISHGYKGQIGVAIDKDAFPEAIRYVIRVS